jgi:hypothetical protein
MLFAMPTTATEKKILIYVTRIEDGTQVLADRSPKLITGVLENVGSFVTIAPGRYT